MALAMNRQPHSSLGNETAYEVFFGRQARWPDAITNRLPNINATMEDIPDEEGGPIEDEGMYRSLVINRIQLVVGDSEVLSSAWGLANHWGMRGRSESWSPRR
jgi:hypothetical protein